MKKSEPTTYSHHQKAEAPIAAPAAKVWEVLADFSAVDTWVPQVLSSHIEGDIETGVGIQRHCDLGSSGKISEKVTHWDEGAESWV